MARITEIATVGGAKEVAATISLAARTLEITQLVADANTDAAAVQAFANALAKAERAYFELQLANLVSLVEVMGEEQLAAGGSESGAKALSMAITGNIWLEENNPFQQVPPDVSQGAAVTRIVSAKLSVSRSFLSLQMVLSTEGPAIATLDLAAPDWKASFATSTAKVLDTFEAHRAAAIVAYTIWAAGLPEAGRNDIVLADGTKAALSLPTGGQK